MANRRSAGLWLGLLGALAATWYAAGLDGTGDDGLLAEPAARAAPDRAPRAVPPPQAGEARSSGAASGAVRMDGPGENLFAARSWLPPAPPPVVRAAPEPPPVAPPLPFRYVGRMEEGNAIVVFLAEGNDTRHRLVRQGDQWPNYRVDEISAQGMRLTYLPLNQTQRLLFGSLN